MVEGDGWGRNQSAGVPWERVKEQVGLARHVAGLVELTSEDSYGRA